MQKVDIKIASMFTSDIDRIGPIVQDGIKGIINILISI